MEMMTFHQYVEMRANEGLWLNDKLAAAGISKTPPPKPPKPVRPTLTPTPKIKSPHVPKSEGSSDQLQPGVLDLGKLGIGLLPPKKEGERLAPQGPQRRPTRRGTVAEGLHEPPRLFRLAEVPGAHGGLPPVALAVPARGGFRCGNCPTCDQPTPRSTHGPRVDLKDVGDLPGRFLRGCRQDRCQQVFPLGVDFTRQRVIDDL